MGEGEGNLPRLLSYGGKMATLHLTLKRKWFDLILSGEKKEEYREIKQHWVSRLEGKKYDFIEFRNGYSGNSPRMIVECREIKKGAWNGRPAYVLQLGKIIEVKR